MEFLRSTWGCSEGRIRIQVITVREAAEVLCDYTSAPVMDSTLIDVERAAFRAFPPTVTAGDGRGGGRVG